MRAWLLKIGEPLPTDPSEGRPYRTGILAARLAEAGHDVVWWSSTFDHATKRYRSTFARQDAVSRHLTVIQLHARPYKRNVSIARIRNHREIARAFAREAPNLARPDVIVCSYPTIELSLEAVRYGARHGIPVILDVRDLWPDIFLEVIPKALRPLGRLALWGMERDKRRAFRPAASIVGTSEAFVDWGVEAAARDRGPLDRAFPHGYPVTPLPTIDRDRAVAFWHEYFRGAFPENTICFFGNFTDHVLDLDTVAQAAGALEASKDQCTFVLCGNGPAHARIAERMRNLRSVFLPGRIGQAEIRVLMENSLLGIVPYKPRWDFEVAIPNKAPEYLSASLPIVTCLKGELADLISRYDCGIVYESGDPASLAAAIRKLVTDSATRARMSRAAARLFAEHFDAARVYGNYVDLIESLAARTPRASIGIQEIQKHA